jgi:phenylpropionate dioxygenase-like ring-hydroxylating dioxygenase large terminal subunit
MPFLKNRWYCAAWSRDLTDRPLGRRILGEYLVLYRGASGSPTALTGMCPHRFAPLDQGVVRGDVLVCPYHGLRFNSEGQCVLNPHGDGFIPPQARLTRYPTTERNGVLWVWMGDAQRADVALLPDSAFLESPDYSIELIYQRVASNYQLLVDNLLDLTHAPFLHNRSLWSKDDRGEMAHARHDYSVVGEAVHSDYYFAAAETPPRIAALFPDDQGVLTARMTWWPAATMRLDLRYEPLASRTTPPLHMPSLRFLTPETETSTHYFSAVARNRMLGDVSENERMRSNSVQAFVEEDEPMVRACQDMMGTVDLFSLRPVILKTDLAAVQARRILAKLIKAEHGEHAAPLNQALS